MKKRAAIYARVSTGEQSSENQLRALKAVAERAGWDVVGIYDETVSGVAGRAKRTALEAVMTDAARRKFDVLMAWDVSRLGRSLAQLVGLFEELRSLNVDLYLDQQGVDTTTPSGRALLGMAAVFAEFERAMIVERTKAGMERARARGAQIGRPPAGDGIVAAIRSLRSQKMGMDRIAKTLKCGKGLSQRVCTEYDREMKEAAQ
ncbi:recombinase family protein [Sulfitobacter donghicola]|uniref:Resolvase n=1 Tax=Sulfitobacter donghicola DSW-25 = KCTC 12864 = JCM 14565 TaxID=1300350 RepID=A0A073IMG7_9RHOB|nr:recombinase family protein [Sulfitobacter donghicola]KEJ90790.1 resolvase [Sulfitobacter donghicola DSW-25 = KCTC 12864 = JCM 14565]KIN68061.1 Resolvase-like protein [Sulfitobacter donghicola DSW-25 = KCTC 12864 = JCM 14565]